MKRYMNFSANDKMVEHTIFWDNVWNVITILMGLGLIYLVKLLLIEMQPLLNFIR